MRHRDRDIGARPLAEVVGVLVERLNLELLDRIADGPGPQAYSERETLVVGGGERPVRRLDLFAIASGMG